MKLPAPDMVIAGKYCLEGQLASGGMGSVWVARHRDLDLPVAVKFMGIECASSEEGRIRFEREAKAAAFLQSPHVVNVQDYGVDDGLAYIVMELLVGEDLEERLHRTGRLSLEETLAMLTQASKALRRAQDLGIVHRDIKPQNFFLATGDDGEEHLKVLDFGIAKETGPVLLAKGTNTGQIIGSPNYMSPEHVRGTRDIDHRADLWSLGVIVFQCVTGRLPFPGEIVGDVMGQILADPIPTATSVAPDLPPEIDAFFDKALARDRNERFQSAREMAEAFAEIVRSRSPVSVKYSLSTPPPPVASRELRTSSPTEGTGKPGEGGAGAKQDESLAPGSLAAVGAKTGVHDATGAKAPASTATAADRPRSRVGMFAGAIALLAVVGGLIVATRGPSGDGAAGQPAKDPPRGPTADLAATAATAASPPKPETTTAATSQPAEQGTSAPATTSTAAASSKPTLAGKGPRSAAPRPSGSAKPKPNWGF